MKFYQGRQILPQPVGMTLIETVFAISILATAALSTLGFYVTSERLAIVAREDAIALYAAEEVINEIRTAPFSTSGGEKIVADFDKETRSVSLYGPEGGNQRLSMGDLAATGVEGGVKVANELGVFIINQESPNESDFGDVDDDGDIDFPVDLNNNGSFTDTLDTPGTGQSFPMNLGGEVEGSVDETIPPPLLKLVPVAVIVRWQSAAGLERRIQILTFITDRSGKY